MKFLKTIALSLVLAASAHGAHAQDAAYPTKPIELILPYNPGSTPDIIARLVGPKLTEALGQPVVISNQRGAGSTIGTRAVLAAEPDGYTIGLVGNPQTIHHLTTKDPYFHFAEDAVAITNAAAGFYVLVVNPDRQQVDSVEEFVEFGRANPGAVMFGSGGIGTSPHLVAEWFKAIAGIDAIHVPFSGTETQTVALLRGDVDMAFTSATYIAEYVREGKLKALAVTLPERDATFFPDLPTMQEAGVDLVYEYWIGFVGPKGIPDAITQRLNEELVVILQDPEIRETLARAGLFVVADSREEFQATIDRETEIMTEVIRAAGLEAQ